MTLLSLLVIFHTGGIINSHDPDGFSYCCAVGAKFYFSETTKQLKLLEIS